MATLVDSNVLVYRFDPRSPEKQRRARELIRDGIANSSIRLPHQAIVEFVAAVTRRVKDAPALLAFEDAVREAESLLDQIPVLYPEEGIVRLALRGRLAYQLAWYDAHLWAYAEFHAIEQLASEDFQDGRTYGSVRVVNPFR